jgi:hypothetical protein
VLGFGELPSDPKFQLGFQVHYDPEVWVHGGHLTSRRGSAARRAETIRSLLAPFLGIFVLLATLGGCSRCATLWPCARVTETTGAVERQLSSGTWQGLERGAALASGEFVKTGGASFAQLALEGGGRLTLEPETLIRFLEIERSGNTAWDVKSGRVLFEAPPQGAEIRSSFGNIAAGPGTRLEITGKPESILVLVQVGRTRIESPGGTVLDLKSAQSVELSANATRLDLLSEPPTSQTKSPSETASSLGDLSVEAGQSLVIHDSGPPSEVRFVFGQSCVEGAIELESGDSPRKSASEWTDRGAVVIRVEAGSLSYKLKCRAGLNEPLVEQATGSLTIVADDGLKSAEERPPSTAIDVTGRHYNVLYRNHLPQVTFRWPDAPHAGRYALAVSHLGRTRTVFSSESAYAFPAGELAEGTHQAQFSAGRLASERTVIAIRRDPSAPVLTFDAAPSREPGSDEGQFRLSGRVVAGYQIEYNRQRSELGPEGQFSLSGAWPPGGRPAVLYVRHPERDTHAYLIRLPKALGAR